MYLALAAGCSYATQNFILQIVYAWEENKAKGFSLDLLLPQFIGYYIAAIIFNLKEGIKNKRQYGFVWSREVSSYVKSNDGMKLKLKDHSHNQHNMNHNNGSVDSPVDGEECDGEVNNKKQTKDNDFIVEDFR